MNRSKKSTVKVVALAGGVGGAKLADGLAQVLPPDQLTIVVNTADDFTHLGLRISPDMDTVCYTLAGLANPETGWGRRDETWNVYQAMQSLGITDWFHLGDSDLATHLLRTEYVNEGRKLSQVTRELCRMLGVKVNVLPMSDDIIQTWVRTDEGELEFQEYFVHRQCLPIVKGFRFVGSEGAKPAPDVMEVIDACDAVIICPSNPWVSIDPILSITGIKQAITNQLVVAVSPIIGNKTIKGPAAKMFSELGIQPSALAVAQHYHQLIHTIFIDQSDRGLKAAIDNLDVHTILTNILMINQKDRGRLAEEIIEYISSIRGT
jgi:LPPG:FO 2-phospho-L-lactate transferase